MNQEISAQTEFEALEKEFIAHVSKLRAEWLSQNRVESRDVYEVMSPVKREEVHQRIAQWKRYITPVAEAWWKERGYGVDWPEDNSKPMQYYKLE